MSSNSNNLIRFNVGSIDNIQASTWRVWQEKDEVYVLAREMKKWLKISFHKSGQCHIKSLTDLEKNTPGDYYMHKWYLSELTNNRKVIETFRITIPANCVHRPMNKSPYLEDMRDVTWIASNQPERICILFITTNTNVDDDLVIKIYPKYSILKNFNLSNRNIYVLVMKESATVNLIQEVVIYTNKLNINYSKKPEDNEKYGLMLQLYKNKPPEILNTIPGENSIKYPHTVN